MSLYGCPLWGYNSLDYSRLLVSWRKCCRSLLNVPRRTHNNLVPDLINSALLDSVIKNRFLDFVTKGLNSENVLVKDIFYNSLLSYNSNLQYRLNNACSAFTLAYLDLFNQSAKIKLRDNTENVGWKVDLIKEI